MKRLVLAVARLVIKAAVVLAALVLLGVFLLVLFALAGIAGPPGLAIGAAAGVGLVFLLLREDRQRRARR